LAGPGEPPGVKLAVFAQFAAGHGTFHSGPRRPSIVNSSDLIDRPQRTVLWLIVHVLPATGCYEGKTRDSEDETQISR
jgi:hypothetical protein